MAKTQEVYHLVQRQEFVEIITHTVYKTGGRGGILGCMCLPFLARRVSYDSFSSPKLGIRIISTYWWMH